MGEPVFRVGLEEDLVQRVGTRSVHLNVIKVRKAFITIIIGITIKSIIQTKTILSSNQHR